MPSVRQHGPLGTKVPTFVRLYLEKDMISFNRQQRVEPKWTNGGSGVALLALWSTLHRK